MLERFLLAVSLLVPLAVGWRVLDFFDKKGHLPALERIFLAYGLGFGCVTLTMFYASLAGIGFDAVRAVFAFGAIWSAGAYLKGASLKTITGSAGNIVSVLQNVNAAPFQFIISIFIFFNIAGLFMRTMLVEFDVWDSWFSWAFKAKIFYHHGIVPLGIYKMFDSVYGNWDYPLHVPLMETWVLLWLGSWNDYLPRILFPIFHAGICSIAFCFLMERVSFFAALTGAAFFASFFGLQMYTIGTIAEPVLLFYYLASLTLLFRRKKEFDPGLFCLSAVFAGIALWTKLEGCILIAGNLGVIAFFLFPKANLPRAAGAVLSYLLIVLAVVAPWNFFKSSVNINNLLLHVIHAQSENFPVYFSRLLNIPFVFAGHFCNFKFWNILWFMTVFAVIYNLVYKKDKTANILILIIFFQIFVYACGYVVLFNVIEEHTLVLDTIPRLLFGPAILSILFCCMVLGSPKSIEISKTR